MVFVPVVFVALSFGLALPNLLSGALNDYRDYLGSAGALLGLFYYLVIGIGLHKAAEFGDLPIIVLGCAVCSLLLLGLYKALRNKGLF